MKKKTIFILSVITSLIAILINYDFIYTKSVTISSISMFNITLILSLITFLFINRKNKLNELTLSKKILVWLFTIFMIVGEIVTTTGNFLYLFKGLYLLLTIIKVFGFYYLFTYLFKLLDYMLNRNCKCKPKKNSLITKYLELLDKYPFRTSFITILVFFAIYIIAFYPIVLSPDPSHQIKMYFNVHTKYIDWVIQRDASVNMTNHHPIFHTYLLGFCISIGRHLLNDNFGLFLYTFIQTLVFSSVLAYTIKFLKKNEIEVKYSFLVLLAYCLIPMYGFFTVAAVKDTFYTSFMILFVLWIYDFIKNYKNEKVSIKNYIFLFFIILLLTLFRQNGKHIVILTIPFMFFFSKPNRIRLTSVFVLFLISSWCFSNLLIPALGISDGSIREALSVPFQQTARLVKYHEDIIEEKDKEIIDKILTYKSLAKRYDPYLADPVKNKFNKYTTKEDLSKYFKVWFKYLLKEPACYINATLNNTYGYFYPNATNWYFYYKFDSRITKDNLVDYHYNNLGLMRDSLTVYGFMYAYIPVLGLLSSIGYGLFAVLTMVSYAIDKKKYKYIIVLVPLITSILVCFVGPANTYFRYAMPYLFVLPVLKVLFNKEMRAK